MTAFLPRSEFELSSQSNVRLVFRCQRLHARRRPESRSGGRACSSTFVPLEKLKRITIFDMDDVKPHASVCSRSGIAISHRACSPPSSAFNRSSCFTSRFPGPFCCRNRNRGTLTGRTAVSIGRIENRFTGERRLTIRSYHRGGVRQRRVLLPEPNTRNGVQRTSSRVALFP